MESPVAAAAVLAGTHASRLLLPSHDCQPPTPHPTVLPQVTVQAGARVQEVADELRKHGLSLQNYASIREQTIGGFTQVWAMATLYVRPAAGLAW